MLLRPRVPGIHSRPAMVVGVDFRSRSLRALEHALAMLACGASTELHLLHVLDPATADAALRAAVPDALAELAHKIEPDLTGIAWAHVREGSVVLELRRLAFDVGADLIVVGDGDSGRGIDPQRYHPFSVLHAGEALELSTRPFHTARCRECIAARRIAYRAFCARHARPGARARAIVAPETCAERVLH